MCPDLLSSLILFIFDIFMETFLNKTKEAKENINKRRYQARSCYSMHMLMLVHK